MSGRDAVDGAGRSDESSGARPSPRATESDEPTFAEPWQARAFALAVALTDEDADGRAWDAFQRELVAEVAADAADGGNVRIGEAALGGDDEAYYRQWLRALERFLDARGIVDAAALVDRATAFESGDRDAHEFVDGDPHAHADRLPEGHADGSHQHGHEHDD